MVVKLTKETEIGPSSLSASKKHISNDGPIHWHEFYEIEYVCGGDGICRINNSQFTMNCGKLFFLTPVDFHKVQTDGVDVINIMFSADMATPDYLTPFTAQSAAKAISVIPQMRPFVETVLNEIVNNQANLRLSAALIDALLLKLSESFAAFCGDNNYTLSQKMSFFIINHFREKISLDDVARSAGVTPTYASSVFKTEMQTGFKSYLNNLRFDYAKKLLLYSNLTVQQICIESGFDDYPNFIRRFKERFKVSPTQFRNNNK